VTEPAKGRAEFDKVKARLEVGEAARSEDFVGRKRVAHGTGVPVGIVGGRRGAGGRRGRVS